MTDYQYLKVENGRLVNDGPHPRTVKNQGPDALYVGGQDVSLADYDQKIEPDTDSILDGKVWLVSAGRSRIVLQRDDPTEVRFQRLEERVTALEKGRNKQTASTAPKKSK